MSRSYQWSGLVRVVAIDEATPYEALEQARNFNGTGVICTPVCNSPIGGAILYVTRKNPQVCIGDYMSIDVRVSDFGNELRRRLASLYTTLHEAENNRGVVSPYYNSDKPGFLYDWDAMLYTGEPSKDVPIPTIDAIKSRIAELQEQLNAAERALESEVG